MPKGYDHRLHIEYKLKFKWDRRKWKNIGVATKYRADSLDDAYYTALDIKHKCPLISNILVIQKTNTGKFIRHFTLDEGKQAILI